MCWKWIVPVGLKKKRKRKRKKIFIFSAARFIVSEVVMISNYPDIIAYVFL
jgi:hypothetical protein